MFHDLRRTLNMCMRKAGVHESVIMKITGHSTWEMLGRHDAVDPADAREAVNRWGVFPQSLGQDLDQAGFFNKKEVSSKEPTS